MEGFDSPLRTYYKRTERTPSATWLGEVLEGEESIPGSPRCTKDRIEEALFDRGRNLFSGVDLVFFDTTSIYFEGEGGGTSAGPS